MSPSRTLLGNQLRHRVASNQDRVSLVKLRESDSMTTPRDPLMYMLQPNEDPESEGDKECRMCRPW